MIDKWLYFGCYKVPGHYLFTEPCNPYYYDRKAEKLKYFDAKLAPQDSSEPYIAAISRLGGWGLTALSFWDYSVDKRGGCNSIFFAPSLTITPEEMLAECAARFPDIWGRFPNGISLLAMPD